ncbi:hypothetical protein [Segatella sp.]|uniref:hypothetical protein n=1 Tax=Segatella sp. TaxID=2974253 RepID=UPI003AAB57A7
MESASGLQKMVLPVFGETERKSHFEYDTGGYALTVGHKPGASEKGKTYIIKPTMVYNKNGKLHKAVITIKMKFA